MNSGLWPLSMRSREASRTGGKVREKRGARNGLKVPFEAGPGTTSLLDDAIREDWPFQPIGRARALILNAVKSAIAPDPLSPYAISRPARRQPHLPKVVSQRTPARLPQGHFAQVDGLRGLLALSVMTYHFILWYRQSRLGIVWGVPDAPVLSALGPGAVNLFFMVTGFVFYPRIVEGALHINWKKLLLSRVLRIMPMVTVTTLIASIWSLLIGCAAWTEHLADSMRSIAFWLSGWAQPPLFCYELSARLNAGVMWSLGYEWAFYLFVLPAAALVRDGLRQFGVPPVAVPVLLVLLGAGSRSFAENAPVLRYLPVFAIGMLSAELARAGTLSRLAKSRGGAIAAGACILLGATQEGIVRLSLHGAAFALVVCGSDFFGLLRSRAARRLGDCSFSLYLLHGFVLFLAFSWQGIGQLDFIWLAALFPVLATIAVALSTATYKWIELPFMKMGRSRETVAQAAPDIRHSAGTCVSLLHAAPSGAEATSSAD